MLESNEIGRKLLISRLEPLFLKIGITLTILSDEGKTPVSNVRLIIDDKIFARLSGISLKICLGMLKSPVLLEKLRLFKVFNISD